MEHQWTTSQLLVDYRKSGEPLINGPVLGEDVQGAMAGPATVAEWLGRRGPRGRL